MDIATVIGLVGAFFVMTYAILLDGNFLIFLNVPSILIVIGGSFFVVFAKFSLQQVPVAFKSALKAFFFKLEPLQDIITTAFNLSMAVRKHGVLALESVPVYNSFLAKGTYMLVDGLDIQVVKANLEKERALTQLRHESAIKIFRAFADVAPALGMIGTLIGLVQMLSQMSNPDAIGPAMAVAILTTLYGAIIANVIATPIADKLTLRSAEEDHQQALVIDAIECISSGVHPTIMKDVLQNYLPKNRRLSPDYGTPEDKTKTEKVS